MFRSKHSRRLLGLLSVACILSLAACGGGGGGGDAPATGAIQVLNNTGVDLAAVAVYLGTTLVDETPGGLAQGASWSFSNLAPGVYEVRASPGGVGPVMLLTYPSIVVASEQTTNLTMTP